jgi:subtilisin family serine protease
MRREPIEEGAAMKRNLAVAGNLLAIPATLVAAFVLGAAVDRAKPAAAAQSPSGRVIPNDPYFKYQVSFLNPGGQIAIERTSIKPSPVALDAAAGIDADVTRAWAISTGSRKVVVAVLDDGFFYDHEDLAGNIWTNPGESGPDATGHPKETNGIDDDKNGYVDDVMGWDFAFDDPDPDCYVFDGMRRDRIQPYWHSISALGIIGARGNNGIGVAGVNWDVSMMLLKIGAQGIGRGEKDTARPGRAAKAIRYAADNGARVINWSGFVSDPSPEALAELKSAIAYAGTKNVLLVVGAGNGGLDIDRPDNILTVAMIDFRGGLVSYKAGDRMLGSNYGPVNVDIAAPDETFTTDLTNGRSTYRLGGGTSCAAPLVTGVAALTLSVAPDLSASALKKVLMNTATRLDPLGGKVGCGRMVNAYKALTSVRSVSLGSDHAN